MYWLRQYYTSRKVWVCSSMQIIGASVSEAHTSVVYGNMCIDRSTDWPINRVCPIHVIQIRCTRAHTATPCHAHVVVNGAVHSGNSYKTENADDGKAKSRDTRATNCEARMRERPVNLFILALPCWCCHPWLSCTSVFLSGHFTQTIFLNKAQHVHTAFWTRLSCM